MTPLILVPTLLVSVVTSAAQIRVVRDGDDRLHGIAEVDVLVEVAAPVARCIVTLAALQATARDALRLAGVAATLSQKARSGFYSIVVHARSESAGTTCAAAVATELVAEVTAIPEADTAAAPGTWGSLLKGMMPLVRESALVITAPVAHDASVERTVRAQVAAIAARIRSVNP